MCENSELRHTILTSQELRCFRISRIKKFQNFWIVEIKLFLFINYVTRVKKSQKPIMTAFLCVKIVN